MLVLSFAGFGIVALAACGSSPTAPGRSPSASASASPSPTATPPTKAQLKKMMIQPSDLGAGWKSSPYKPDPNEKAEGAAMDKCLEIPDTDSDDINNVDSPEFDRGNINVSSEAGSVRSASDITSDISGNLKNPRAAECLKQEVRKIAPDNADVTADPVTITAGSGGVPGVVGSADGSVAATMNGESNTLYIDETFIDGPLTEANVTISSENSPVPKSLLKSLVARMAKRVAKG